jgi:hypothetical protein
MEVPLFTNLKVWPRTAFTLLQMAHQLDVDPRYHLTRHPVGTSLLSLHCRSYRHSAGEDSDF